MCFLVIFGGIFFAVVGVDYSDKGECFSNNNANPFTRNPNSQTYYETEYCILINS